jgi:pimeloyl-ACP methyl ester carboxylesterase
MRPPGAELHRERTDSSPDFGTSPPEHLGAGELSAITNQPKSDSPDKDGGGPGGGANGGGGGASPGSNEKLKSLQRGLLNDVPTDSLDLQQLVRTGERTKVWRARWRDTGDQVTVKAIDVGSAELELDLKDDLRREVDSLRDCRHPHIVSFHLSYVDEGRLWVVMAYHDAVSIRELLSSGLSERCIRYICTAVLSGLAYIHGMGKTHRYVKGANILLDGDGVVRLGDFGVAEQLSTLTRNKATIGTPYWMAPEVVLRPRDSPTAVVHEKSDVWSLGITAIEMAEILPPHASSLSPVRVLKAIAEGPPPTFSWSEPSALLRSFATACLAKELSKRPTAEECLQHEFLHCMRPARVAEEDAAAARVELLDRREEILLEQAEAAGVGLGDFEQEVLGGRGGGGGAGGEEPVGDVLVVDESLPVEGDGATTALGSGGSEEGAHGGGGGGGGLAGQGGVSAMLSSPEGGLGLDNTSFEGLLTGGGGEAGDEGGGGGGGSATAAGTSTPRGSHRTSMGSSFGSAGAISATGGAGPPPSSPASSARSHSTGTLAPTAGGVVAPRTTWQPDADATQCPGCQRRFNPFTLRKHHCRGCGVVFCAGCSRFVVQLAPQVAASLGVAADEPQRTCEECFPTLSSIEWARPYDVHGEIDAPVVLLLHDTTGCRSSHEPTTAALVESGYRVLTLDLPAHGSRWKEAITRTSSVAAVKEVIDAEMGLVGSDSRTMVLGVGLGGYVAMLFAAAHPEDVSALLLVDVAVAHPGTGAGTATADAAGPVVPSSAPTASAADAFSFISGGAVARAQSYLRWGFSGAAGPRLAPARLPSALEAAYPGVSEDVLSECFLRPGLFLDAWSGATALLQAHEPTAADAAGSGGIEGGAAGGKEAFDWRTAGWLEVAASIEKPVLSLNSEYSNRKDEHAFSRALRAGQLEVLEGATHCTLEQDSLEAFRCYLLDWLRIVHPIAD